MYPTFGTDPTGGYGGVAAGVGGPYAGGSANSLYGGNPYGAAAGAYSSAAAGAYSSATGYGTGSVPTRTSPGSQQTGGAYGMGGGAAAMGHHSGGMMGYNMGQFGMSQMPYGGMGNLGGTAGLAGTTPGAGSANPYYNPAARLGASVGGFGGMPGPSDPYGAAYPQPAARMPSGYGTMPSDMPGMSTGAGKAHKTGRSGGGGGGCGGAGGGATGGAGGSKGKGVGGEQSSGKGYSAAGKGTAGGKYGGDGAGGKGGKGHSFAKGGELTDMQGPGSKGRGREGAPHSNLFMGNMPDDVGEKMLREALAPFGKFTHWRVMSRNGRTCAMVRMETISQAQAAIKGLNGFGLDPQKTWSVKFADSDFDAYTKGFELKGAKGGNKSGKGGMPFSQFPNMKGFGGDMAAAGALTGGKGVGGPRREREPKESTPSENLYVKGLPPRVTEGQLHVTFAKAGNVVELKILRYGDSLECAALVRMDSVASAQAAIDKLNGTTPEGAVTPLTVCYHGKDPNNPGDNLYVKGLPLTLTQDHLHLLFGQCGTVRRTRVLPSSPDGAIDSAALVQMASIEEAQKAIQLLNGRVPDMVGPQMLIRFAEPKNPANENKKEPSDNLYVKGLPLGTPDFLLRAVFCQYGNVLRSKVLEPRGSEASDCAALVQMESVEQATAAVEALHGQVLAAPLPPMRVRFAGKEQEKSANLYIAGLPTTIMEQQLRTTFAKCGTIVRLRLLVDAGKPETHALVQMGSAEEAQNAIDRLHNQPPESMGPTLIVRYAAEKPKKDDEPAAIQDDAPAPQAAEATDA